jgi:hypothetical protein
MSLDGLRAWIGEVERKLGLRTRVFLALAVIAVGGAGAAIYLAVEAQNDAVSESDVQTLQRELEARIGTGAAGGSATALEAEIDALRAEVQALKGEGGASNGTSGGDGSADKGGSGKSGSSGSDAEAGGASTESVPLPPGASGGKSAAKLGELLQKAKEENEAAEKAEGK